MSQRWRSIGRVLLVASVILLTLTSGIAVANDDHGTATTTPATTASEHHEENSHHDETTQAEAGHHDESGQSSDGHTHEGDEHGEEGLLGSWLAVIGGLFLVGAVATTPTYKYLSANRERFEATPIHLGVALLALLSAAVHLYLFLDHGEFVMLLASAGFVGGIGLFFAGFNRQYLYAGGVLFTLVQIPLWVLEGMPHLSSFGLLDKVAQVLLIILLGYLYLDQR